MKYYRVIKKTFMWEEGAILKLDTSSGSGGGYTAISDVWDSVELDGEYISARIIEHPDNTEFFERVYPIGKIANALFGSKKQAQAAASALYQGDK